MVPKPELSTRQVLRGRIRTIQVLCLVMCILLIAVWGVSIQWTMFWMAQFGDSWSLNSGVFSHGWTTMATRQSISVQTGYPLELYWTWHMSERQTPLEWIPVYQNHPYGRGIVTLPIWIPVVLLSATSFCLAMLQRRLRSVEECHGCGYNLRGLSLQTPCPECGVTAHQMDVRPALGISKDEARVV